MSTAKKVIDIQVYGDHEPRVIEQLARCVNAEDGARGVLMADGHLGYSQPIGGAVAYRNHISPSGVGYDIGCGNKAVKTNLRVDDLQPNDWAGIADEINRRISFGMGRKNNEPVDHDVLELISKAPFEGQRGLAQLARDQLGTVGAGNHYVDLFKDEDGWVWIGVHFGSRGFGHKTASGFLALAAGKPFDQRAPEGEMDSPPVVFPIDSELGQSYIEAMELAGLYAYAGRDVVVDKVLEILGAEEVEGVHNHHNYAWRETHDGEEFWVVRKGCTPAFDGQRGFVGATMGEQSVILEGTASAEPALFSTVHGAGRQMSRTQAAGKQQKVAECSDRDCHFSMPWKQYKAETSGLRPDQIHFCPDHPNNRVLQRWKRVREGAINWPETLIDLNVKGIQLRGGAADEAPGAYKRLDSVLAAQGDTINVLHTLTPLVVVMAGNDVVDPFKD